MVRFIIRHRLSILGTLLFHVLVYLYATYTYMPEIVRENEELLVINFPEEELQPEEPKTEEPTPQTPSENLSNKGVNESAPQNVQKGDYNEFNREPTKSSQERFEKQLAEELKAIENQVIQEQRDAGYGYTQEEVEKMLNSKKNENLNLVEEQKPRSEAAYQGNTNISYKLENRYDTRLFVPVYLCQYGGVVVVNIAVDRNGNVVSAKVDKESSKTSDPCLLEAALSGARSTKFNSKSSAPEIQLGSIRYQFIEQ